MAIEKHQETPQVSQEKQPKCWWRRILCGLSAVILLLILALVVLLGTGSGQRALVRFADQWLDSLSIAQVEGDLKQGLLFNQLRYQTQGVNVELEQLRLQLDWACLWQRQLCIQAIQLEQPKVQIDTALLPTQEASSKKEVTEKLNLPISIKLDELRLHNAQFQVDQHQIQINNFSTALELHSQSSLRILPSLIEGVRFDFSSIAEVASVPKAESKPIDWELLEQQLTPAMLSYLPEVIFPFDLHLAKIQGSNWQLYRDQTLWLDMPQVVLQASIQDKQIVLETLVFETQFGKLQSAGNIQLEQNFPLDFRLNAQLYPQQIEQWFIPESELALQLTGQLRSQTQLQIKTRGIVDSTLNGSFYLNQEKTPFSLSLQAKNVVYPFEQGQNEAFSIPHLQAEVTGDLLDYQLHLNANMSGLGLPKSQLDLALKGRLPEVEIEQLQLDTLQGKATMHGKIGWQNKLQWYQRLYLSNLILNDYVADLPLELSGELFTAGLFDQQQWLMDIPALNIWGKFANKPLNLKGELSLGSEKRLDQLLVKVPNLDLTYGKNKLNGKGRIGERSDFQLEINAPELTGLLPHLRANMQGSIRIQGDIAQPNIDLALNGQSIQYQNIKLNQLRLNGNVDFAQWSAGNLNVQLAELDYTGVKLKQTELKLTGDEQQHQLQFSTQGSPLAGKWQIQGSFDRTSGQWQGNLLTMLLQSPIGEWKPQQQVAIDFNTQQLQGQLSAHCWQNTYLNLCFKQPLLVGKNGHIVFNINELGLGLVNQILDKELLKGKLSSEGEVAWFADKPPQLNLSVNGENLSAVYKIDYRTFKLAVPKLELNASLRHNQLMLQSALYVEKQGKLLANIDVSDLSNTKSLTGRLIIQQLNLNMFNQLLSENEQVQGNITGNLSLTGSAQAPNIVGEMNLKQLSAVMKDLPFDITGGQLGLSFQGNRSQLQGYLQTPDSRLNLVGDASWQNINQWTSRLHAQANSFNVVIPNMAKVRLSPNVEIKAAPDRVELSGEVNIPWARVEIESLPDSAVSVSKDEVILDGKAQKNLLDKVSRNTKSGTEIISDLKITLGDDVRLNAYGLKTHLSGLLSVKQEKENLGLFGQIRLSKGQYASFGQDLLIRKGLISFSGSPSQPMLDIEAIRNPEAMESAGIVAGVKVTGLAENPRLQVFSEPSMPQDQALSYVLTGNSLENSGPSGSGGSIGAALLGLGLAKSGKLVGGIGEAFGIQDLNLGTQGVGDNSKVVVSGSITPRLHIKYGVGLFDGLAELTVRYRLLPKLYVQSVSGVTQAVDLLYQFEF